MSTLTDVILAKSSLVRFKEAANFKHSQFMILTEDDTELGLKQNAELIDIAPYKIPPYTGRAEFRLDRTANVIPLGEEAPKRRYIPRHVLIRQMLATEIINAFGVGGVVYLGITRQVPTETSALAARFKELFGLEMVTSDIENQTIPTGATCVVVRFHQKSVGFKGALRVDLTTPITAPVVEE